MPMTVFQAGGLIGNTAGDTGAIVGSNWVAAIDLGAKSGATYPAAATRAFLTNRLANVHPFMVITHYHGDHGTCDAGNTPRRQLANDFGAAGVLYDFPTSNRDVPVGLRNGVTARFQNVVTLAATTAQANTHAQLITGAAARNAGAVSDVLIGVPHSMAAVGAQAEGDAQENKYSGAVYAEHRNANGVPVFAFLSLGDMDNASSAQGITAIWNTYFHNQRYYPAVLVIKLPHHASGGNWNQTLTNFVTNASNPGGYAQAHAQNNQGSRIYVLASGHTGSAPNGFDSMRRAINAGALGGFVLVANITAVRTEIGAGMRAMWANNGLRDKIRLLGDATIAATDNGAVTLTGRPWQFRYDAVQLHHTAPAAAQDSVYDLAAGNHANALENGNRPVYGGRSIVLDPAHGGSRPVGSSTPFGQRFGSRDEKDIVLAACREAASNAGTNVQLTRRGDENPSLGQRIATARNAEVFVSVHAGELDGPRVWLHDDAGPASVDTATQVAQALEAPIGRADLAVLHPGWHGPDRAAVLVELPHRYGGVEHGVRRLIDALT